MRIGRIRKLAAKRLSEILSWPVEPIKVEPVTGFWKQTDVYRWEYHAFHGDRPVSIGSFESLTEFVKAKSCQLLFRDYQKNSDVDPKTHVGHFEIWVNN